MFEVASLIIVNLTIALIIGIAIGFIIGRTMKRATRKKVKSVSNDNRSFKRSINPIFAKNSNIDNKPFVMSTPSSKGKDELTKINGINSQIETDLNNLEIFYFEQISSWSHENCAWVEEFLRIPHCIEKDKWISQAKSLEKESVG